MTLDVARDLRNALAEPKRLCDALGLARGAKPCAGGLLVLCPSHGERNPSCSVSKGRDGTVRVRCHSCSWTGDALTLVAACRGLDLRRDFREVLAVAAELAGMHSLADDVRRGNEHPEYTPPPAPRPLPERRYPTVEELRELRLQCGPVQDDREACAALVRRRIDPLEVDARKLGWVVPVGASALPRWASYDRRPWTRTGHRLLLPAFDAAGQLSSVRAWRLVDGDSPKRLPPAGCRATGLVLANLPAVRMLRGKSSPDTLLIVEGEPDFLSVATRRKEPTIGIFSGSWGPDFAARVPAGCDVFVWTHPDDAGERYAVRVRETLEERVAVWRAA